MIGLEESGEDIQMAIRERVASLKAIPENEGVLVEAAGQAIALFRRGTEVFAIGDSCPHMGAPLSDGYVDGNSVVCPWHGWVFDLKTGASMFDDEAGVPAYRVVVEGDDVYVELAEAECGAAAKKQGGAAA
jgi:NAD(P)H-dependent nitrite reductase small subunit